MLKPAAVLLPLQYWQDDWHVLLTLRSSMLRHHPGQIALPGGKVDADDATPLAAALREAHEEIGLHPDDVSVLGSLPKHETVTSFNVSPFVGVLPDGFEPIPEAGEVEEVFRTPLSHVLDVEKYSIQSRRWQNIDRQFFTVPFGPYYIWGATARMLRLFADKVGSFDAD